METEFATFREVAERLEIKPRAVQRGQLGTDHLKKIHRGPYRVRYVWRQVQRHKEIEIANGKCEGECADVFEVAQVESGTNYLRAVNKK